MSLPALEDRDMLCVLADPDKIAGLASVFLFVDPFFLYLLRPVVVLVQFFAVRNIALHGLAVLPADPSLPNDLAALSVLQLLDVNSFGDIPVQKFSRIFISHPHIGSLLERSLALTPGFGRIQLRTGLCRRVPLDGSDAAGQVPVHCDRLAGGRLRDCMIARTVAASFVNRSHIIVIGFLSGTILIDVGGRLSAADGLRLLRRNPRLACRAVNQISRCAAYLLPFNRNIIVALGTFYTDAGRRGQEFISA